MSRRPDIDVLADYLEGLLGEAEQREVERWAAEDPRTAELLAELRGLPGLLADTPVEPMPADVAARLDAALAAEAPAPATGPEADPEQAEVLDPPPGQVVPLRRRRRWLAPALVAAATVGVVGLGAQVVGTGSDGGLDAATSSAESSDAGGLSLDQEAAGEPAEERGDSVAARPHARVQAVRLTRAGFEEDVKRVLEADWVSAPGGTRSHAELFADVAATRPRLRSCLMSLPAGASPVRLDDDPAILVVATVDDQPQQRRVAAYPATCGVAQRLAGGAQADLTAAFGVDPIVSATVELP
jgi:hypothetical protein